MVSSLEHKNARFCTEYLAVSWKQIYATRLVRCQLPKTKNWNHYLRRSLFRVLVRSANNFVALLDKRMKLGKDAFINELIIYYGLESLHFVREERGSPWKCFGFPRRKRNFEDKIVVKSLSFGAFLNWMKYFRSALCRYSRSIEQDLSQKSDHLFYSENEWISEGFQLLYGKMIYDG